MKAIKKSIKKIAGDLLIYLYSFQRENAFSLEALVLNFNLENGVNMTDRSKFGEVVIKIADNSSNDAYNAFKYLFESGFINYKVSTETRSSSIYHINLTSAGIDIIEGIERGAKEKDKFNITFNIKLAETINIESLIKTELGSLIKTSLL